MVLYGACFQPGEQRRGELYQFLNKYSNLITPWCIGRSFVCHFVNLLVHRSVRSNIFVSGNYPMRTCTAAVECLVCLSVCLFVCQFVHHFLACLRVLDILEGSFYTQQVDQVDYF